MVLRTIRTTSARHIDSAISAPAISALDVTALRLSTALLVQLRNGLSSLAVTKEVNLPTALQRRPALHDCKGLWGDEQRGTCRIMHKYTLRHHLRLCLVR